MAGELIEIEPAPADRSVAAPPRADSGFVESSLRFIRRGELRKIVPLADTTIYKMERRGEFPRRFYLTSRCVAWDLAEVEAWMRERRLASCEGRIWLAPMPDVCQRKIRPVVR